MKPEFCAQVAPKFSMRGNSRCLTRILSISVEPSHRAACQAPRAAAYRGGPKGRSSSDVYGSGQRRCRPVAPVAGGVVLASYNPQLTIGAGTLTLLAAAALK